MCSIFHSSQRKPRKNVTKHELVVCEALFAVHYITTRQLETIMLR